MTSQTKSTTQRQPTAPQIDMRHYEVRIDGSGKGRFEDLRDAISSARITKLDRPLSRIVVADNATGQLVIEME